MTDSSLLPCMRNRELSWLDFNLRVLEEAEREKNPLLERFKFAVIFHKNLDEFFMVRVGSMCDKILVAPGSPESKTGLLPAEELKAVLERCRELCQRRDNAVLALEKLLAQRGIGRVKFSAQSPGEQKKLLKEFERDIIPLLSPQIIDARHPFPHIANKQLHIAVLLERKGKKTLGVIPLPRTVERMHPLDEASMHFILSEDLLLHCADKVFGGFNVLEKIVFAVTRSADIDPDEWLPDDEEDDDYRLHMKKVLKKRLRLAPVRLEIQGNQKGELPGLLLSRLGLSPERCFYSRLPPDLGFGFSIEKKLPAEVRSGLTFPPHVPVEQSLGREGLLKLVAKRDILLSYPFESIKTFLNLLREAGRDREVLSIKITLYRIAPFSELAAALMAAAENGKEVLVLIELRARFDEENNINWAKRLEEAGCRVIYGPDGYKAHAKLCLITRREHGGVRYITQIGTGNYNEDTAKQYTDLCLITSDREIGLDAAHAFLSLSLGSVEGGYSALLVAPREFSSGIVRLMNLEIEKARANQGGHILLKCNSLTDSEIISKLVEASRAGVRVELIVRGLCCVRAGVPGFTDNITLISIVGRFLEHSRIYCFGDGGERQIFISSGDLMTRSTTRRVEVACPVRDIALRQRISDMLDVMLRDNVRAREQGPDWLYSQRALPGEPLDSQEYFCENAAPPPPEPLKKTFLGKMFSKR